ncbi:MAG: hypothetical protein JSS66_03230 [Armatimonadetes bacterium]|nr:hypothetical protein [Armatimonadota bacterium]
MARRNIDVDWDSLRAMDDVKLGRTLLADASPITAIISALLVLLVYGQIAKRAGFSRWSSLWLLLPIVGSLATIVFAFARWPVESKSRSKKVKKGR